MSLTKFLATIWDRIKSLFDAIPADIKLAIQMAVSVTENIKNFVNLPGTDILTALIPGNITGDVKDKLKQALPALLDKLNLVDHTLNLINPDDIVKTALNTIRQMDAVIKPGVLHQLSILIAQVIAGGKLTWSDGVYLLQWYYQNKFKPVAG